MIYKDMFKFALSSLSSFIVDYLVYAFFLFVMMAVPISLRILLANGIARVASSIFNYSTNKRFVFKNKRQPGSNRKWLLGTCDWTLYSRYPLDSTFLYKLWSPFAPQQSDRRTLALRRLMVDSEKNHFQGKDCTHS